MRKFVVAALGLLALSGCHHWHDRGYYGDGNYGGRGYYADGDDGSYRRDGRRDYRSDRDGYRGDRGSYRGHRDDRGRGDGRRHRYPG